MANQPSASNRGHYISSIPDPLWERAQTVAAQRGESVSAAVRRALAEYIDPVVNEVHGGTAQRGALNPPG
jgi:hypothetical protein